MSRIGKAPIPIPPGVSVTIEDNQVTVKGPKGELVRTFNADMAIALKDGILTVSRPSDERQHRSLHGLTRTLLANMVEGVTKGYERALDIVGVGYRAEQQGENLVLNIGFSHQVVIEPLPGNSLSLEGASRMKVAGMSKEDVGQQAASIRAIRPPDAYKGKGIRYGGEVVRLKAGKAGKAAGR